MPARLQEQLSVVGAALSCANTVTTIEKKKLRAVLRFPPDCLPS